MIQLANRAHDREILASRTQGLDITRDTKSIPCDAQVFHHAILIHRWEEQDISGQGLVQHYLQVIIKYQSLLNHEFRCGSSDIIALLNPVRAGCSRGPALHCVAFGSEALGSSCSWRLCNDYYCWYPYGVIHCRSMLAYAGWTDQYTI